MTRLKTAVLGVALAALAAPLFAAPKCGVGVTPRLTGDLFSPVECSTATKTVLQIPGTAVEREGPEVKTDLRDLDGRWEGTLIQGMGRYSLLLTIKTAWGGKTELTLDAKELQFRDRLTDRLTLTPGKEKGVYAATLVTSVWPEGSLKGNAILGAALLPAVPAGTKPPTPDRQADLVLANRAVHRAIFTFMGKDKKELRVRTYASIPGAPLQMFELTLTRTKRETL